MDLHPSFLAHPFKNQPDFKTKPFPIQLHGDGVPVTGVGKSWSKSVNVFSWAHSLVSSSAASSQIMVGMFHKHLVCKDDDNNATDGFLRHLCWSLRWMKLGLWPDKDADGVLDLEGSVGWRLHHEKNTIWRMEGIVVDSQG